GSGHRDDAGTAGGARGSRGTRALVVGRLLSETSMTPPSTEPELPGPAARDGHPALPRRFGLLQATALNMTNMIGVGPFITIPLLMGALGGPQAMVGWLVA